MSTPQTTDLDLDGPTDAPKPARPIRVLALAGGGYRGLFTCEVLARIEKELNGPVGEVVDLTIGTSAGALIAAGIANGKSALEIAAAFRSFGPLIFPSLRFKALRQGIFGAPYRAEPLSEAIDDVLGESTASRPMRDLFANLAVTAVSQTASEARIYASGQFKDVGQSDITVKEAILASAAAPTYFPPRRPGAETLIDGGIAANAPELVGLALVNKVYGGALERARIIAIGTAAPAAGRPALTPRSFSFASWMRPSRNLLLLTLEAQEHLAMTVAADLLGSRYCKVDQKPTADQAKVMGALDATSDAASNTMVALAEIAWNRDKEKAIELLR
jgi:predicted acylesterase/phospholipase RssA